MGSAALLDDTIWRMNAIRCTTGKSTYVALLRGINVGRHKAVKMEQLREAFAALFLSWIQAVRTLKSKREQRAGK